MPATGVPTDLNEKCNKLDQEIVAQKVMWFFSYLINFLFASLITGSLSTMSVWLLSASSGNNSSSSNSSVKTTYASFGTAFSTIKSQELLIYRGDVRVKRAVMYLCSHPPPRCPPGRSSWETLQRRRSGWATPGRSPSLTPCHPPVPLYCPPEVGNWCHGSPEYESGVKHKRKTLLGHKKKETYIQTQQKKQKPRSNTDTMFVTSIDMTFHRLVYSQAVMKEAWQLLSQTGFINMIWQMMWFPLE